MNKPKWLIYLTDLLIFVTGVGVVIKQTGFPFILESPESGPNVWALAIGALFCNSPVVLQALSIRFGIGSPTSPRGSSSLPSSSDLSSDTPPE